MRYADTLLTQGEVIVVRARQHWLALFLDARTAVALWIIGVLMLSAVVIFNVVDRTVRDILSYIGIGAIVIGVAVFLYHFWRWWSQDYLVTNRRILKVEGVFNKHAADSSLEKINDAVLDQNIVGRMLNYGDLDILTAADSAIDRYKMLSKAPAFKREMLQQKYALETEFAYHAPPSPPLRASSEPPEPRRREESAAKPPPPMSPTPPTPTLSAPPPARRSEPATDADAGEARPADDLQAVDIQVVPPVPGPAAGTGSPAADAAIGSPTPAAAAQSPVPAAPVGAPSMDADSTAITQTLARLADLRDRGAITPEEYQAKKDELLARL